MSSGLDSPLEWRDRLRKLIDDGEVPEKEEASGGSPSSLDRGKRIPGKITEGHREAMREMERLFLRDHPVADEASREE